MTRHPSIRRRLFLQLVLFAAVLSVVFYLVVRVVAENAAERTQDDILSASATAIAESLRSEGGAVTLDLPYSSLAMLGTVNEDRIFYRISNAQQTLTGYSDLPGPDQAVRLGVPVFYSADYRGDTVRVAAIWRAVGPASEPTNVLVMVAQTRRGLEAISSRITSTATFVGVGFFGFAMILSLLAARSTLSPIERLTSSVTRRGPGDLRPVETETPAELVPLVEALNSFMARLQASLMRTEDFIAEAAHRVRTPLATVRTQAEVTHRKLTNPVHKAAIREMIRAVDESSRSAGQMLDHAMVTFRADSLAKDQLDLRVVMAEVCDRLGPTADLKDILIHRTLPTSPVAFLGDGILIQAALQNILDNAIKYSSDDSEISAVIDVGAEIRLSVIDQGRGFGKTNASNLKIRYSRGDNVGDIVGSGLGLTIADDVARAHGGRLDITQNIKGAGACVTLVLPLR